MGGARLVACCGGDAGMAVRGEEAVWRLHAQ